MADPDTPTPTPPNPRPASNEPPKAGAPPKPGSARTQDASKEDIEAQLHARASRISGRFDALKDEADPMATAREKAAQARRARSR